MKIKKAIEESDTKPYIRPKWEIGQSVRVNSGPFGDFTGSIQEINAPKDKVKVLISIFGRDTPVELDYYKNGGILQTVIRKLL